MTTGSKSFELWSRGLCCCLLLFCFTWGDSICWLGFPIIPQPGQKSRGKAKLDLSSVPFFPPMQSPLSQVISLAQKLPPAHFSLSFQPQPLWVFAGKPCQELKGELKSWRGSWARTYLDDFFWLFKVFEIFSRQKVKRLWQSISLYFRAQLFPVPLPRQLCLQVHKVYSWLWPFSTATLPSCWLPHQLRSQGLDLGLQNHCDFSMPVRWVRKHFAMRLAEVKQKKWPSVVRSPVSSLQENYRALVFAFRNWKQLQHHPS